MKLPHDGLATSGRLFIDLKPEIATAIMQTVEAGWVRAQEWSDVNVDAYEEPITERLRDGMRQALQHEDLPWSCSMVVLPGTESRSGPDVLLPDGRIDIPILIRSFYGHDPHAIIECKRVAGNNARLCREYVKEGIDRFGIYIQ